VPSKRIRTRDRTRVAEGRVGKRNETSTSKTIKRMASKKNFIQKGT
jgi:hypothetical protein